MKFLAWLALFGIVGCQTFDSARTPASVSKNFTTDGRDAPVHEPDTLAAQSLVSAKAASTEPRTESVSVSHKASRDGLYTTLPVEVASATARATQEGQVSLKKIDLKQFSQGPASPDRKAFAAKDWVSKAQPTRLSLNDLKQKIQDRYGRTAVQRRPQANGLACNSVQVKLSAALAEQLNQAQNIRSISTGPADSFVALTQSKLSHLTTSRTQGLSMPVIQDQANILTQMGSYPTRIELSQLNSNDSVMLVGRNGYNVRLSSSIQAPLTTALANLNSINVVIHDVELAKDQPGYVVLSWPNEAPAAGDYSGYYAQGVPGNLLSRLAALYSARQIVSLVALGPASAGQAGAPWILVVGNNLTYSSGVASDVLEELDFLRSIDAHIQNIEFDRQGGLAISYYFDDYIYSESSVHFQVADPAGPAIQPTLKLTPVGNSMQVSFVTRADHSYQLQESTDLKNWTTLQSFNGDGNNKVYTSAMTGPKKFWRAVAESLGASCDRIVSNLSPDISYIQYSKTLDCRWNGSNYQPYNNFRNYFIGPAGYGFQSLDTCNLAVTDASQYAVCSWNGSNYQAYNADTNKSIGPNGYGFSNFQDCRQTTVNSFSSVLCVWDGAYSMYQSISGLRLSKSSYGFSNLSSCVQSSAQSRNGLVCAWSGSAYSPYYIDTNKNLGKADYGTYYQDACLSNVSRSGSYFACNYNGSNYQPYSIDNNTPVYRDQYGFSDVDSCQQTTELSDSGQVCNYNGSGYSIFSSGSPATPGQNFSSFANCKAAQ